VVTLKEAVDLVDVLVCLYLARAAMPGSQTRRVDSPRVDSSSNTVALWVKTLRVTLILVCEGE